MKRRRFRGGSGYEEYPGPNPSTPDAHSPGLRYARKHAADKSIQLYGESLRLPDASTSNITSSNWTLDEMARIQARIQSAAAEKERIEAAEKKALKKQQKRQKELDKNLWLAAGNGDRAAVVRLFGEGANPNAMVGDGEYKTALNAAIMRGKTEVVEALIQLGAKLL